MDDALAILDYLLKSYRNNDEERCVVFLWESFATNYESGKWVNGFAVSTFANQDQ